MIDKNKIREVVDALYLATNSLIREESTIHEFMDRVDIDIAIESIKVAIEKLESVENGNSNSEKLFPKIVKPI